AAPACFSIYSDMSIRISAFSSSNKYSARALVSSVLPTPVGPRNMNEPIGRAGSRTPARARVWRRHSGARASPGGRNRMHGVLLGDDALGKLVLHTQQLFLFALEHP